MRRIRNMLYGFIKYRSLLYELVARDIKIRYRRSILGVLWTILNPVMMMIVMTLVFSNIFRFEIENFPIYFFCGNILFSYMVESTTNALYSIVGGGNLIKKVYIPKYLFPLSKALSGLVNLFFSFIAMLGIMLLTGAPFHVTLLMAPLVIAYVVIFSIGLGLILSMAMVFFRDVAHLYSIATLVWMYLTPVFYPPSLLADRMPAVLMLNPMYHFISMMRDVVLYGNMPSLSAHITCAAVCLLVLVLGLELFYSKQDRFILFI